jgi:hypothetical protein
MEFGTLRISFSNQFVFPFCYSVKGSRSLINPKSSTQEIRALIPHSSP